MAKWTRDICGSVFEFSDWGVDVVSLHKPAKYAALSDAEHWEQVATFECAGMSALCRHIVDTYPALVGEPLGDPMPLCFGIDGTFTYNEDLTVTLSLNNDTFNIVIQSWADSEFGAGKVTIE